MEIILNKNWLFTDARNNKSVVDIPHDAMIHEKRDKNCHNGVNSGFFPGGKYTYEKDFEILQEQMDKEIKILFEAVYRNATVYLNNKKLKYHAYGYTEFWVDCTENVECGINHLRVEVDNSLEPNCRWYSGSGIFRPVHLYIQEPDCPKVLKITTLSYDPPMIEVYTDAGELPEIYERNGKPVEMKIQCHEIREALEYYKIEVIQGKLWSYENPNLYELICGKGEKLIRSTFGIRQVTWDCEYGLRINGRRELLRGGCIHHDHGILGACSYKESEYRRVKILKQAGFNAIRVAHNPASRYLLDACDELGMYVMDEAFDGWYTPKTYHDYSRDFWKNYEADIKAMVLKDLNRPCVIMYSVGNEVSETASEKGAKLCGQLRDCVLKYDTTRPVTAGINVLINVYTKKGIGIYKDKGEYKREPLPEKKDGYKEKKSGSAFFNALVGHLGSLLYYMSAGRKGDEVTKDTAENLDVLGLNYASSRFKPDLIKYPNRLMVATETMVTDLPYNWEYVKKEPRILGDFVWAAWDYLGEAGIGDYVYQSYPGLPILAGSGVIDITGKITVENYYEQIIWGLRKAPYLSVAPLNHADETPSKSAWRFTNGLHSWNWNGYEGQKANIEVFSDSAYVRLECNGRAIGTKPVKKYRASFKVPFEQGELIAYALDDGKNVVGKDVLKSGDDKKRIIVKAEEKMVPWEEDATFYITVSFVDGKGEVLPYEESEVELITSDSGSFLAMGSALGKTDESYLDTVHRAYRGELLAVVQKKNWEETVTITVRAKDCEPVSVDI